MDKGMKQNWYLSSAVAYSEPSQVFYFRWNFLREKIVKNVEPCQTSKIKLLEILQNICSGIFRTLSKILKRDFWGKI